MKNIFKLSTLVALLMIAISCGKSEKAISNSEDELEVHGENGEGEEGGTSVSITNAQLEVMNIALGTVKEISLGNTLKVNGQLELPPQNMASVSALMGGRVKSISVIEGDYIKKGQVIARLENPEFIALQQKYLSLKSNLSFLENDYNRKKSLAADGITSKKALQKAEADYLEGKGSLNAAKATLQILNVSLKALDRGTLVNSISVVSPIKGYVQTVSINIGLYIAPQQQMFSVIDNDFLHLGLNVFEKDINEVKVGQKITFALTTQSDKIYQAEIFSLGRAFEINSRSVKVHAKIVGDHEGLIEGMFVDARILTSSKMTKALPNEAFVSEKGLDYVFVQTEEENGKYEFEKTQVNKGTSDLGFSEVLFLSEIDKDAIVVLKGAYYLSSEMQKEEFGDDD